MKSPLIRRLTFVDEISGKLVDTVEVRTLFAGKIVFFTKLTFFMIAPRPLLTPPYEKNLRLAFDGFCTSMSIFSLFTC